jgi:hypothetical protein
MASSTPSSSFVEYEKLTGGKWGTPVNRRFSGAVGGNTKRPLGTEPELYLTSLHNLT